MILPRRVFRKIENLYLEYGPAYYVPSYSQEGEDVILHSLFHGQEEGCYVDVGAHHPRRFSNTFLFYRMGWRGINIEPDPGNAARFVRRRKRDVNLQLGIGPEKGFMEYFQFDEAALNTFDRALAEERSRSGTCRLLGTIKVPVRPLVEVLEAHLMGRKIDFMDIDTEGMDLQVLKSNDWDRYRPAVVLVEMTRRTTANLPHSEITGFLAARGYLLVARTPRTGIFTEKSIKKTLNKMASLEEFD
jgi:FkbM family methyltransferase